MQTESRKVKHIIPDGAGHHMDFCVGRSETSLKADESRTLQQALSDALFRAFRI